MSKLKAFPYDAEDPLGGDHEFCAPGDAVDFVEGDTYEMLVDKINSSRLADVDKALASGEISQEMYDAEVDYELSVRPTIAGFWVVTEQTCSLAAAVWPQCGCDTDSATYQCNSAAKRILKKAAVGEIRAAWHKPGE
jgi:hypothetical protein